MSLIRIAILEDDESVRKSLQRSCAREGYIAYAIPLSASLPPETDVVLADFYLDKDSKERRVLFDVISKLRALAGVVAVTGAGTVDLVRKLAEKGVDAYVAKPWDRDNLVAGVEIAYHRIVRRRKLRNITNQIAQAASSGRTWDILTLTKSHKELEDFVDQEW